MHLYRFLRVEGVIRCHRFTKLLSDYSISASQLLDHTVLEFKMMTLAPFQVADLGRVESWMFCGFLLCQGVVDVGQKNSAEYRIWTTLLQGSWVVPIIRYHIWNFHDFHVI